MRTKSRHIKIFTIVLSIVMLLSFNVTMVNAQGNNDKIIKGVVFIDKNGNGILDSGEQALTGIQINLFNAIKVENSEIGEGISVYKETLIEQSKTDKDGTYHFKVQDGQYSLNLDINSLPDGYGVVEPNIFVFNPDTVNNFVVRDVADIDIGKEFSNGINIGDEIQFNPILKDEYGNSLSGKMSYTSDDSEIKLFGNVLKNNPKEFKNRKSKIKVSSGKINKEISVDIKVPNTSSLDKVSTAFKAGIIDEKTKYLYYLYSIYDQSKLPEEYKSSIPSKSATSILKEVRDYLDRKDADKQVSTAYAVLAALPTLDKSYTNGWFTIHYTTTGTNAVSTTDSNSNGIPDYIETVATAFNNVKSTTCTTRGFRTPVLESGKSTYQVYVYDLGSSLYGRTISVTMSGTSPYRTASSYIEIDNDYSWSSRSKENCAKVTAAHEFFHAIQYAYNVDADSWWKEASAEWNEDEIYDSINIYVDDLIEVFNHPTYSLDSLSGNHEYGEAVFAKYLSEKWGGYTIIKNIWTQQTVSGYAISINAIDKVISDNNSGENLGTIFKRFAACNYRPVQYYEDYSSAWPTQATISTTWSSYPVSTQTGTLNYLASDYKAFTPTSTTVDKCLKITVDGADNKKWGFKVQSKKRSTDWCDTTELTMDGTTNRAEILNYLFGATYKEICLIPSYLEKSGSASYTYSASIQ
ncbi:MXAN_6640 family putative metalloprotease [Caldicellulosiruptoraceae bacterium PP1]